MPAKKQTRSRTSNSKVNKKNKAPRWVIAVVLLIIVGTGAFLIYKSFASTGDSNGAFFCNQGRCTWNSSGVGYGTRYRSDQCYYSTRVNTWVCGFGSSKRR